MSHSLPPATRGSTLRTTLDFLRREGGAELVDRVLDRFPSERRQRVVTLSPTEDVGFDLLSDLMDAADAVLRPSHPDWAERSGGYAIESSGLQLYPGILRKSSPLEFLTQPVSLFRLYYQPGNMEVVEHEPGRAVLRLVGFHHGNPLFCRRQTGGLQRALQLAGGRASGARHVRCTEEGDAFCEWELRWEDGSDE